MKLICHKYFLLFFAVIQFVIVIPGATKLNAQSRIQQFDDRVMIGLQESRTPPQTDVALFLSRNYRYGEIGIPAALLVGGIVRNDWQMRENSLYIASSTAITYGLTVLIKHLVKRPRPFVQNINIVPVYRAGSTSFPSGHASTTFSTAMAFSNAYPKWYVIAPAFLWAGATSYSRMYLGVHYPTDVAAGMALGTGTALLLQPLKR